MSDEPEIKIRKVGIYWDWHITHPSRYPTTRDEGWSFFKRGAIRKARRRIRHLEREATPWTKIQ